MWPLPLPPVYDGVKDMVDVEDLALELLATYRHNPARGPSFRGLEYSRIASFSNHFIKLLACCPETLVFQILIKM